MFRYADMATRDHTTLFLNLRKMNFELQALQREKCTQKFISVINTEDVKNCTSWKKSNKCAQCNRILIRKHHCRVCGNVICDKCSKFKLSRRICIDCDKNIIGFVGFLSTSTMEAKTIGDLSTAAPLDHKQNVNDSTLDMIKALHDPIKICKTACDTDGLHYLERQFRMISTNCATPGTAWLSANISRAINIYLYEEELCINSDQDELDKLETLIEEYVKTTHFGRKRILERQISRLEISLYGESKIVAIK